MPTRDILCLREMSWLNNDGSKISRLFKEGEPSPKSEKNGCFLNKQQIQCLIMTKQVLSDQIRCAIDSSGMSRYRICVAIKLSQPTMSRFMNGKGGLSLDVLDRLADLLGLSIVKNSKGNQ